MPSGLHVLCTLHSSLDFKNFTLVKLLLSRFDHLPQGNITLQFDAVYSPVILLTDLGAPYHLSTWLKDRPGEQCIFGLYFQSVRCEIIVFENVYLVWLTRFPFRPFYLCYTSGRCCLRTSRAQCVILPCLRRPGSALIGLLLLLLSGDVGRTHASIFLLSHVCFKIE